MDATKSNAELVEAVYNQIKTAVAAGNQQKTEESIAKVQELMDGPQRNLAKSVVLAAARDRCGFPVLREMEKQLGLEIFRLSDENGDTVTHIVAESQTVETLEFLKRNWQETVEPEWNPFTQRGNEDRTVAHFAAKNLHHSVLKWFIEQFGTSFLTAVDKNSITPIHLSATYQGAESMQFIKEKMNGVECFNLRAWNNMTVVHAAAFNKLSSSAFEWLVNELGPDCLAEKDADGSSVIHLAAQFQGAESMQFIKEKMSGMECFKQRGMRSMTVVHYAAANIDSSTAFYWLVKELGPDCLKVRDFNNDTAIHIAAEFQQAKTMMFIKEIMNGADCFEEGGWMGRTAVHCAAFNTRSNSSFKSLVKELGPSCLTKRDSNKHTPIHLAARFHGVESMLFIKETMNTVQYFNLKGFFHKNVLQYACCNPQGYPVFTWLVNELGPGCLIEEDELQDTAIHQAARFMKAEAMQFIKEKMNGVDCFRLRGMSGMTAVHAAACNSVSSSALEWLVKELGPDCLMDTSTAGRSVLSLCRQHQCQDLYLKLSSLLV